MEKLKAYQENPEVFSAGMRYESDWIEGRVKEHFHHDLTAVTYGGINIAIECVDCSEVVWDNGK
jgi:hypothetical protein